MKTSWNLERCSRSYVFGLWSLDSSWGRGRVSWRLETFLDFGFRTILMFFFFRPAQLLLLLPPRLLPSLVFLFLFLFIFIFIFIIFIFAAESWHWSFLPSGRGAIMALYDSASAVGGRLPHWHDSRVVDWLLKAQSLQEGWRIPLVYRIPMYVYVRIAWAASFCSLRVARVCEAEGIPPSRWFKFQVPSCGSESALPVTAAHRRRRVIHMYHGARLMPVIGPVVWLLSSSGYCMYGY